MFPEIRIIKNQTGNHEKKIITLFTGALLLFLSCTKENPANNKKCNVDDPLEALDWLHEIKQSIEMSSFRHNFCGL
ncbi:hypothetical protein ES703_107969 [subsurface metagenome]